MWSLPLSLPQTIFTNCQVHYGPQTPYFMDLKICLTRMHSSRIRTARSLTMGGVPAREVYLPRGVYLPGGCTCPVWGVYLPGGCTCQGVYLPGGCICLGGGYLPRYSLPLWTEFLTHATENITLPQLRCVHLQNVVMEIRILF